MSKKNKSVEEQYQKKTPIEHVLLRPDTYVGSVEMSEYTLWTLVDETFKLKKLDFCPAFYKVFDEILSNAADNKVRDPDGMTCIKVSIDAEAGKISVYNDGRYVIWF
jgi:DNA topoisomerase-2